MMREHGVNWCFMPYKRAQLISSDNIPPLHRNELSVFHNAVQPHYYTENMPSKKTLIVLSSPEVMMHSCLLVCKGKITNHTDMSVNLKKISWQTHNY